MTHRLLALTLAACGPSTDTGTGGTSTTMTSGADTTAQTPTTGTPTTGATTEVCPDHAAVDDCCCFRPSEGNMCVEVLCPTAAPCGAIQATCDGGFFTACGGLVAAEVDCHLAALQADAPGTIAWQLQSSGFEEESLDVRIHVSGTGEVFWIGVEQTGDPVLFHGVRRHSVAALNLPACAAEPTAAARFDCMHGAFNQAHAEGLGELCLASDDDALCG